jgi:colanic acid/amylovoran biosynthesis glycosyltransferase
MSESVAQGIYTYSHHFSPFVYDMVANLRKYDPIIFTHGIGVHENYRQWPVYAPNVVNTTLMPSNPMLFRRLTQKVTTSLKSIGLYNLVLGSFLRRGKSVFAKAVQEHQVRLIHAHFGPIGLLFVGLCQELRLPLVVSTYGYDVSSLPRTDIAYLRDLPTMFRYAAVILAMSEDMRSDLISLGCSPDKIVIHHTGVDVDRFRFVPKRRNQKVRILTVCHYVEKKGLPYLIQAFSQLRDQFPSVELRIVGRGKQNNQVTQEVDHLIKTHNLDIQQQPFIPPAEISEEFAQADVFVLPSVTTQDGEKEGVPTVLMEAQSSGLPVVSTWHAGIPEVVIDGRTGFLVKEREVHDLAEKLIQLLRSEELRRQMGQMGRAHIEREFNIRIQAEKLERVYDTVTKRTL